MRRVLNDWLDDEETLTEARHAAYRRLSGLPPVQKEAVMNTDQVQNLAVAVLVLLALIAVFGVARR